jgi:hypothetical protein
LHEVQKFSGGKLQGLTHSPPFLLTSNPVPRDSPFTLVHSNFTAHNHIHTLLRHRPAVSRRRTVEIAVLCPESLHTGMLRMECTLFYKWLVDMHHGWIGDVDMHVHLRPMPETYTVRVRLEMDFEF